MRLKRIAAVLFFASTSVGAQTEISYSEDFQPYAVRQAVSGWVASSVAETPPRRRAVGASGEREAWAAAADPADPDNRVFGVSAAAGAARDPRRSGVAATYIGASFEDRFTFTGRFYRGEANTRAGIGFYSALPESARLYVIAAGEDHPTMKLLASDGDPVGSLDSGVDPEPRVWYRFRIEVEEIAGATAIRARIWRDGTGEPATFPIVALDASPSRPLRGRISVWAAGGGEAWFDDLHARSEAMPQTSGPSIHILSPQAGELLDRARVVVTGRVAGASAVAVNGVAATIDEAAGTFTTAPLELPEGASTLTAVATDEGGLSAESSVAIVVDTRAPDLVITSPVIGACVSASVTELHGEVFDPALSTLIVTTGSTRVEAAVTGGRWSAKLPVEAEGRHEIRVEAADRAGHTAIATTHLIVDRTAPLLEITASGTAIPTGAVNRAVAPSVTTSDASPLSVVATLDGAPYQPGTRVDTDGEHHIRVVATDCAGNQSEKSVTFTIDRSSPALLSVAPQHGSTVGVPPVVSGTTSPDAVSLAIQPLDRRIAVANGSFTVDDLGLKEGRHDMQLVLVDAAGNESTHAYSLTIRLTAPVVEILDDATPIAPGALYNRTVTPVIRSTDPDAATTATLNGQPFQSGTPITADGSHAIAAFAVDSLGHRSETVSVSFIIDTTAPSIAITAPADAAVLDAAAVDVQGTVAADAVVVVVNGTPATVQGGAFTAHVTLQPGPNIISATASDAAGNTSVVHAEVSRATPPAIVLTWPPDGLVTNRRTVVVSGQVFATDVSSVEIGGTEVPVDHAGLFRRVDVGLTEGDNVIAAEVRTTGGAVNQTAVRVVADRTPPHVRIIESGQPLQNGARFASQAVVGTTVSDGEVTLLVDGTVTAEPATITAPGVHRIVATARDAAGNESRVERTIAIGATGAADCALSAFNPDHRAVVGATRVLLTGRSGGAAGVRVNGTPASVSGGTFCATVDLPNEGDNSVTVTCADASGNQIGAGTTVVFRRVTGDPSIEISTPAERAVVVDESVVVRGTTGADTVSVEVNGVAAAVSNGSFEATGVRLTAGLNIIVARALNAAGRSAVVSRRVVHLRAEPSLSITSPPGGAITGAAGTDVSGVWQNLDPATIAGAVITRWSDTTGAFVIPSIPLVVGDNVLRVEGRDEAGRTAEAAITVTRTEALPALSIYTPADHSYVAASAGETVAVEGMLAAAPGSIVEVNGVTAAITGDRFSAAVALLSGNTTPVVARVTEPGGAVAIDTIRIHRSGEAPRLVETFPAAGATGVAPGALMLFLFSSPMDRASLDGAVEVATAAGVAIPGTLRLDRDVLAFAPSALLTAGAEYTMRVKTAARDLAGRALAADIQSTFTVAGSAGMVAPTLLNVPARTCGSSLEIAGMAPPSSRLRIEAGPLRFTTTAAADGSYRYTLPLSGQAGYQIVRVRVVGADGSASAAAESCVLVDCGTLQVVATSFDRVANRLHITFSSDVDPASATPAAFTLRTEDGRDVAVTVLLQAPSSAVVLVPAEDLTRTTFTLTVSAALAAYSETFEWETDEPPAAGDGSGFVSGEVFNAETGWPLAGATLTFDHRPDTEVVTDPQGRYAVRLAEGAHAIRIAAEGYVTVWRRVIVAAGAGVIPIDVRLASTHESGITPLDAQTLPGLLPLGWSPAAAAAVSDPIPAELTFSVPYDELIAATQTLSAVRYMSDRDEWSVLAAVVNVEADGRVVLPITDAGTYALVYGDKGPGLQRPPPPVTGAILEGLSDPCATATCPPLVARTFTLDPPSVLPTGRATATLVIEATEPAIFPSGTAVQASIDEELRLADGTRIAAPPFTTDLILQRTMMGDTAVAQFRVSPSDRAATAVLEIGFSRVRIIPYPGRVDRGSILGAEGGRVPGDGSASVDIPAGAAVEPLRATTAAIDTSSFSISGFEIVSGFHLTMQNVDGAALAVELLSPARVTLGLPASAAGRQHVLVEVVDDAQFGRVFRLVAIMDALQGSRATTRVSDRATLPLDGVVREGRYLLLAAIAPIAYTSGTVRFPGAALVRDALVTTTLGVSDLTRGSGLFALPVPAAPAVPFMLVPSTRSTGDGEPYVHAVAPPADTAVAVGEIELLARPPALVSTFPVNGTGNASLTTSVRATFSPAIDPASVAPDSIQVFDGRMQAVAGSVSAEGVSSIVWTLPPGVRLAPDTVYTVALSSAIRGTNGTPLGTVPAFSFATVRVISNAQVRRDRIRISVPDGEGHARVWGDGGALPAGWIGVPVRRVDDFDTRYQATAAADGSFSISLAERVDLDDVIDLQVINTAGAIAAIVPLTPFVTADGRGFVARPDRETRYLSADGAAIIVPAGAFSKPVTITSAPSTKEPLTVVPKFDEELRYTTSIRLDFEGVAGQKLDLELPVPAGTDTNGRQFLLGWLGESVRGPRIMIVSTLRVENGMFTTVPAPRTPAGRMTTNEVLTGDDVSEHLNGVNRAGIFTVVDLKAGGFGWAVADGINAHADIFWDALESLYAAAFYVRERGRVAIPVPLNRPFRIVGVDASTGLQAFARAYDPLPILDPGAAFVVPSPNPDEQGPYPVFGTPFRVEVLDVQVAETNIESVRNFVVRAEGGFIRVSDSADALPANINVSMANVTRGEHDPSRAGGLAVPGERGDRIVLMIEEREVEPAAPISIVFNEPIYKGGFGRDRDIDAYLSTVVRVDRLELIGGRTPLWHNVTPSVSFRLDSGDRRLLLDIPGMQRGASYRVTLAHTLADASGGPNAPGLRIGQALVAGKMKSGFPDPVTFHFHVRAPGGLLSSFDLSDGSVRDLALNGNILVVAAQGGGIQAYDVADPAGMTTGARPLGVASGPTDYWAVASDHHGRVFATGIGNVTGALQTFRLEQFTDRGQTAPRAVSPRSGTHVSWAPGAASSVGGGLAELFVSDRPEGIPRKIQILLQDDERLYGTRAEFVAATGASAIPIDAEFDRLTVSLGIPGAYPYFAQRITVENVTLDLRWSADATQNAPALIDDIIARPSDRMRVLYNQFTYAVVAIFGYGVGVYDVNAVESNDWEGRPFGFHVPREQVRQTRGSLSRPVVSNPCSLPGLDTHAIRDLTFVPEAAVITRPDSSKLDVYALDPHRGVLDLEIAPPENSTEGSAAPHASECERAPYGLVFRGSHVQKPATGPAVSAMYDHPRLAQLRALFEQRADRRPFPRFNQLAHYRWRLEAADNRDTLSPIPLGNPNDPNNPVTFPQGARGSIAGQEVQRDYLLVAGFEYGLLVVEVGGTPPVAFPTYKWLGDQHLVDIIWVPTGVAAVRAIPRTSLATVIDGSGHALLVDLSRLDERFDDAGQTRDPSELFPSVRKALSGGSTWGGVGAPDPRVVWRSPDPVAHGTLAPVIDPDTGILFSGQLTRKTLNVLAAIDPRIQVKVDLAGENGLSEVGGIVPLGIEQPASVEATIAAGAGMRRADASLGAFRLEVSIPGAITEKLLGTNNRLHVALESERVAGGVTEQLTAPYPRAHLRSRRRDGTADPRPASAFYLDRVIPPSMAGRLRYQRGFNKYISPWVVAIADPRASIDYEWPQGTTARGKAAAGCFNCERPRHLAGKREADGVWEIYSAGRMLAVRPDFCSAGCATNLFSGTPYAYLGSQSRMVSRFPTVMADTVRPTSSLVAAQNAPVAPGALQSTVYLHSGEAETSHVDLDAGGRSGWNVAFDRTYRSQTIGISPLGPGWESGAFRRIRALPGGAVEYRDTAGETYRFAQAPGGGWLRPPGLHLNLTRMGRGWRLVDQKSRITDFDELGRIAAESDEFADDPTRSARGNVIRYLYGPDGRLAQVVDPLGRASSLRYYGENEPGLRAGRLREVEDWRGRKVTYEYDAEGRLSSVALPDVANVDNTRPVIQYSYEPAVVAMRPSLEISTNLRTVTDPAQKKARVTMKYGSGDEYDRIVGEEWTGTGETASFSYDRVNGTAAATDALGQRRTFELTAQPEDYWNDRAHVRSIVEHDVLTSIEAVGVVPPRQSHDKPPRAPRTRRFTFAHDGEGLLRLAVLEGVRRTTWDYRPAPSGPGQILDSSTTKPEGDTPGEPILRKVIYQPGTPFVQATETNGVVLQSPEPHRGNLKSTASNDGIESVTERDEAGRPKKIVTRGGTDPASTSGSDVEYHYVPDTGPLHSRGALARIERPAMLPVRNEYPSVERRVMFDERNVRTDVELDAWMRPEKIVTTGLDLTLEEASEYDASGRRRAHHRLQGSRTVSTKWSYDTVGRPTEVETDNVAVNGTLRPVVEKTVYELRGRTVTRTLPSGATIVETLDTLGRVTTRKTTTGVDPLIEELVYDLAGNLVWRADDHVVTTSAFDAHGRAIESIDPAGSRTVTEHDPMGRPESVETFAANGALVGSSTMSFSAGGRLESTSTRVDAGVTRETRTLWDGAGRQSAVEVAGRASRTSFDTAGRMQASVSGGGTVAAITRPMQSVSVAEYDGRLARITSVAEGTAQPVMSSFERDTAGNVTRQTVGSLRWEQDFDQAGNVTSAALPDRPHATYEYDGRGALTVETMAGGTATIAHQYDAAGGATQYRDQTAEVTESINDDLGRPRSRSYADGTSETFDYDGQRLLSTTDRQGRVFNYTYTLEGQVDEIRDAGGALLDKFGYDEVGRMTSWTTPDARLTWENFDLEGRAKKTTQTRLDAGGRAIDTYVQEHTWNVHGERSSWTMPSHGGFTSGGQWTQRVIETHDDGGNVTTIDRQVAGSNVRLLDASYRNVGRPERRTTFAFGSAAPMVRDYGYNGNGQMSAMTVSSRGLLVAGSIVEFDGLQVAQATLAGLSAGTRANQYSYDDRGRLAAASFGREAAAPSFAIETLSPADDRLVHDRRAGEPGEPPSLAFVPKPAHKIAQFTRGTDARTFAYGGAERVDDGRFRYDYDGRGRMIRATEKGSGGAAPVRRIQYYYSGNNRVVGRRAEYGPEGGPFKLEDRADILEADGLPAEVTYAWDVVTDRIAAIYRAGASANAPGDPHGGLLRQIIHGGLGYDDPIEVAIADGEHVRRLYPVFDDSATGALQLVLNTDGEVISRQLGQDPYGAEESTLAGAGVDRITVKAKKSSDGVIMSVEVNVRLTEQIDPATIANGARISGTPVTPTLSDPFTLRWTLTFAEWAALPAMTVQLTSDLRAAAWSQSTPILPPPGWALATKPVSTSASVPFEYRETATSLSTWLDSIATDDTRTTTLYEVENLATLAGKTTARPETLIVASAFQALPFTDPATGLVYARERWLDLGTGTFLSPDPLGYRDSSNLYAFCGGDPINCSDPQGLAGYFFDGTWNDDSMKNPTNVVKLRNIYREKVEYLPGVGTTSLTKWPGGGFGAGGQNRLEEMYQLLISNFNGDDRNIDIFGFSRGAALAIAFANLIQKRGIPDLSSAREEYEITKSGHLKKVVKYERWHRNVQIRFLGIFDTVGSFGLPGNELNAGYDLRRPRNVKAIRHAVAQNEHRHFYPLTSMLDAGGSAPSTVAERAFRGAHADIGGGYPDNDELSRVPLGWMWEEAVRASVPLGHLPENQRTATPSVIQHDESSWFDHLLNELKGGRSVYWQAK